MRNLGIVDFLPGKATILDGDSYFLYQPSLFMEHEIKNIHQRNNYRTVFGKDR